MEIMGDFDKDYLSRVEIKPNGSEFMRGGGKKKWKQKVQKSIERRFVERGARKWGSRQREMYSQGFYFFTDEIYANENNEDERRDFRVHQREPSHYNEIFECTKKDKVQ